jgi:hypothetical protein
MPARRECAGATVLPKASKQPDRTTAVEGDGRNMNTDERDIKHLVARLRKLGRPGAWGRASARYDHMGAKLADAVLQRAVK